MNEENKDKNQAPKTSKLAKASFVCILIFLVIMFSDILLPQISKNLPEWFTIIMIFVIIGLILGSFILGVAALIKIKRSSGFLTGKGRAKASVAVSSIMILASVIMPQLGRAGPSLELSLICQSNLRGLGAAIMFYANEHDDYIPTSEKWCDLLINKCKVEPKAFRCRGSEAKRGQSSYALNKNIAGMKFDELPDDVVMLFETKPGWNQVGGPEIQTADIHKRDWKDWEGCNVLFADGYTKWIRAEDFDTLRWEP